VRDEQTKVLHAIQPIAPEDVLTCAVRGQYGQGVGAAYRDEPLVAATSNTETFAAMKLQIDNWRWADVPFYLRTGKRMPRRVTEIAIQFTRAPFRLFRDTPVERLSPNRLVMHIQPDEGITLRSGCQGAWSDRPARCGQHGLRLRRLLRRHAEHRLRATAV